MKKIYILLPILFLSATLFAQKDSSSKLGGLFKKAGSILNSGKGNSGSLSADEIVSGLKEALSLGAQKSGDKLSAADGFFKDAVVKILMPPEVSKFESKLRALGMGSLVDNAILSMNRAAEDASKSAAPIFIGAVKKMTVQDALGILRGPDTAATAYLKTTTSPQLTEAFRPVIQTSLDKVDATKYWKDLFTAYNKVSLKKVNTDLNAYVTERALNGIFYYVGEEEKKIRTNPAERVSDILKKVFGSK